MLTLVSRGRLGTKHLAETIRSSNANFANNRDTGSTRWPKDCADCVMDPYLRTSRPSPSKGHGPFATRPISGGGSPRIDLTNRRLAAKTVSWVWGYTLFTPGSARAEVLSLTQVRSSTEPMALLPENFTVTGPLFQTREIRRQKGGHTTSPISHEVAPYRASTPRKKSHFITPCDLRTYTVGPIL